MSILHQVRKLAVQRASGRVHERFSFRHRRKFVFLCCLSVSLLGSQSLFALRTSRQSSADKNERREQTERIAAELKKQADELYQRGDSPGATKLWERVLAIYEKLYAGNEYPHGHVSLAFSLNNLGVLNSAQGKHSEALRYHERALKMRENLYPIDRYPRGHREIAQSLSNLGAMYGDQGDYLESRRYLKLALEMRQKLYPATEYPKGHLDLTVSLSTLGELLCREGDYSESRRYYESERDMLKALYPKAEYPGGHADLALCLSNLGLVLRDEGNYPQARTYLEQSMEMYQNLYPKGRYPRGHPDIALVLNNLGFVLNSQGDSPEARRYYERSIEMLQALYPKEKYPHGHPQIAANMNNLGFVLDSQGDKPEARRYHERALNMLRSLYPKETYPRGQDSLARSLSTWGSILEQDGNIVEAQRYHQQAIDMLETLYPREKYPRGHSSLVSSLNNMGHLLKDQGKYSQARGYYQRALNMAEALYSKEEYPYGHPKLATVLNNLGFLHRAQGDYLEARRYYTQSLDISEELTENVIAAVSEAEALNFLSDLPATRDGFLSASLQLSDDDALSYDRIWRSKAIIFRILRSRNQAILKLADQETRRIWEDLLQTRRELAHLILAPSGDRKRHMEFLERRTALKEKLERQLAARSASVQRLQTQSQSTPASLLGKLSARTVFIDLLRYVRFVQDPNVAGKGGERQILSYVAFLLCAGQPLVRVDLGDAEPIDSAVTAWRRGIIVEPDSSAAKTLRQRLWVPLVEHFPSHVKTVLLAPDGSLTQVPWAALPGDHPNSVLLDDYAFAIVPHGPFLLDCLTTKRGKDPNPGRLLTVGGVQYDLEPRPVVSPARDQLLAIRAVQHRGLEMSGYRSYTTPSDRSRGGNPSAQIGSICRQRFRRSNSSNS